MFPHSSAERFLEHHWQSKPLLIRSAFPDFEPPVGGDDLAGLACEPDVESRLVQGAVGKTWSLDHGPLDSEVFESLGESNWTLLVQDVDKHVPQVAQLLQSFGFLPTWRMDDIMVSYSVPGGSVGPHTDQYDVFLLQAQGRRRWQWSASFDPTEQQDSPLKMLASFVPENEAILQPGDMLYLPPGVAHHGVALDEGLTYSIGFRTPTNRQLMMHLAEAIAHRGPEEQLLSDAGRAPCSQATAVTESERRWFRNQLRKGLQFSDAELDHIVGELLTRPKPNMIAEPSGEWSEAEVQQRLCQGDRLVPSPTARFAHFEQDHTVSLFADGMSYEIERDAFRWIAPVLEARPPFSLQTAALHTIPCDGLRQSAGAIATQLLNAGSVLWQTDYHRQYNCSEQTHD